MRLSPRFLVRDENFYAQARFTSASRPGIQPPGNGKEGRPHMYIGLGTILLIILIVLLIAFVF